MEANKRPIILVGGGTGGHIFPLIALAEELQARSEPFIFVGSRGGLEEGLVGSYHLPYRSIYSGKWRRYFTWQSFFANVTDLGRIIFGFFQAISLLWKTRARVVVCKGGYVAVPVVMAARILNRRVIVHESDAVMGLTNRFASVFADKVLTAFNPGEYPKHDERYLQVGIPIRRSLRTAAKLKSPKKSRPLVLIMPGSQGSSSINQLVLEGLKKILEVADIVHMVGTGDYETFKKTASELPTKLQNRYKVFAFIDRELPYYFQAADLVIGRASATTLAEAALFGKAVYLIPLPNAASDHQSVNAKRLLEVQAAWVDEQRGLDSQKFTRRVVEIINNPATAHDYGQNLKKYFNIEGSIDKIIEEMH